MVKECDMNNDGSVDKCERLECVVRAENEFRAAVYPDMTFAYCPCEP
jgi:hypothetical protein